jgi:(E)-4-hydroxy-3-methylbut-2-enyl-diphosphate synthase
VARELATLFAANCEGWTDGAKLSFDPFAYGRRETEKLTIQGISLGGDEVPRVVVTRRHYDAVAHKLSGLGDFQPELVYEDLSLAEIDPRDAAAVAELNARADACLVSVKDGIDLPVIAGFRLLAAKIDARHPILLKDSLDPQPDAQTPFVRTLLGASARLGSLLCDGIGDAVLLRTEDAPGQTLRLSYNILQAVGARIFKTDYVACPSCGRTLFNLQETTARIKAATQHLKGVKIAIMGCIVNGPGEMADADFGYVGGAPGKVNLYVGKKAVKFNIPEAEAVDRLVDLIKEHGRWFEAEEKVEERTEV